MPDAARYDDVPIPFGSVDPLTGSVAIEKARRLVDGFGVPGDAAIRGPALANVRQ